MIPTILCCLLLLLVFITSGFQSEHEKVRELNQSLLQAVAEGSIDQIKSVLSKGASVNAKDEFGWTALHVATAEDSKQVISSGTGQDDEGFDYLHRRPVRQMDANYYRW